MSDARRVGVRPKDADGFARLNGERLMIAEALELADDGVVRGPVASRFTDAAVDDQLIRPFRHVGIEIVHQHPKGGLGLPALGTQGAPTIGSQTGCNSFRSVCVARACSPAMSATNGSSMMKKVAPVVVVIAPTSAPG